MDRFHLDRRLISGWLTAITLFTIAVMPRIAWAEEVPTADRVQVDLGVRYGLSLESLDYNPWGLGFGGGVGYTRKDAIFLGIGFDWYQGEELEYPDPTAMYPDAIYIGGNYWQVLINGGYDLTVSDSVILRPKIGVGWATSTIRDCNTLVGDKIECAKTIRGDTSIVPAVQLMFVSPVTVSLEGRFVMLFDSVTVKTAVIGGLNLGF